MDPKENNDLAKRLVDLNESLQTKVDEITESHDQAQAQLAQFQKFGTPEQIEEAFTQLTALQLRADTAQSQVSEIVESINAVLGTGESDANKVIALIGESLNAGKEAQEKLLSITEQYGTVESIDEAFSAAETKLTQFKDICEALKTTPEQLLMVAEQYGTISEITESVDAATNALQTIQTQQADAAVEEVAQKYGKPTDDIKGLMTKYNLPNAQAVEEMFTEMGIDPVGKGDEDVTESFQPGSSLHAIMTGKAFKRVDINEDANKANRVKQHDDISESHNSPERLLRLL